MVFFFPRGVLDEILNLIESVSEGFSSYSSPLSVMVLQSQLPNERLVVVLLLRVGEMEEGVTTSTALSPQVS